MTDATWRCQRLVLDPGPSAGCCESADSSQQAASWPTAEGIVEALLAWRRLPWVHAAQVRSLRILEWSAQGWHGTLYLRVGLVVAVSVVIDRAARQAAVDWHIERALAGNRAPPGCGVLALSWGSATAPAGLAAELRYRADADVSERLVPALEQALRCARTVMLERAALLNRRIDGRGDRDRPAAGNAPGFDRCPVCLGPLLSRGQLADARASETRPAMLADTHRRCGWEGHRLVADATPAAVRQ